MGGGGGHLQAYLEHMDSPCPSSSSSSSPWPGALSTLSGLMCGGRRWMDREEVRRSLPFPSTLPWDGSACSSACFTSQCKCGSLWMKVRLHDGSVTGGENRGRLGTFHSVRKHAEHTTLNTDTQQLLLSKCSWVCLFFFFVCFCPFLRHRVALGYTEHNATNRTRLDRRLQTTSLVYMLCMPHR